MVGEVVWRVPPLPVPLRCISADELTEFAAVRLFVGRARLKLPAFALTAENAGARLGSVPRARGGASRPRADGVQDGRDGRGVTRV